MKEPFEVNHTLPDQFCLHTTGKLRPCEAEPGLDPELKAQTPIPQGVWWKMSRPAGLRGIGGALGMPPKAGGSAGRGLKGLDLD